MLVVFVVGILFGLCDITILPLIPASLLSSVRSIRDGLFLVMLLGTGLILINAAFFAPDSTFEKLRFIGGMRWLIGGWTTSSERRSNVLVWGVILFLLGIILLKFVLLPG
jgi:hypothetical protein